MNPFTSLESIHNIIKIDKASKWQTFSTLCLLYCNLLNIKQKDMCNYIFEMFINFSDIDIQHILNHHEFLIDNIQLYFNNKKEKNVNNNQKNICRR